MKMRRMTGFTFKVSLVAVLLLVLAVGGLAAYVGWQKYQYIRLSDSGDLLRRIKVQAEQYVAERDQAALVVGVIRKGEQRVLGFGKAGPDDDGKPGAATLYEIGSVTKVFTAVLLARLVEEGKIGLNDTLRQHLPEEVEMSDAVGRITLKQLATHTSGLPRLPPNLGLKDGPPIDPYNEYAASDLYEYLSKAELKRPSGKKSVYSNLGYGVLGHLLELSQGVPYKRMVKERICIPLEMTHTVFEVNESVRSDLVPGHNPDGEEVSNWHFQVMAPAGALRSNASDLLKFIAANLNPKTAALTAALERAQKTHFDQLSGRLGLGWHIKETVEGPEIWWHNGGTGGYVSFVGFDPENEVGVVLLSNYGDAMRGNYDLDGMGMEILRLASKVSMEPEHH